jgi:hypothetical protein
LGRAPGGQLIAVPRTIEPIPLLSESPSHAAKAGQPHGRWDKPAMSLVR